MVVLAATVASWGGRIGLLGDDGASFLSWVRIVGSLVVGLSAAAALATGAVVRPVASIFVVWTSAVWMTSSISVWAAPNSAGFRVVHSILAVAWLAVAWLTWKALQETVGAGTSSFTTARTSSAER